MKPLAAIAALIMLELISCKQKIPAIESLAAKKMDSTDVANYFSKNAFASELPIPEVIHLDSNKQPTIEIRAFQHKFNKTDSTWVIGYVNSTTPRGKETLLPPTFEVDNGVKSSIRWVNRLQETMINNPTYPKLKYKNYEPQKYYPIIYNVNDTSRNPADSTMISMLANMLYPADIKKTCDYSKGAVNKNGEMVCRCPDSVDMSTYYSTTVHLHGAWVPWNSDGYPNTFYLETDSIDADRNRLTACTNTYPKRNINFGLFGPFITPNSKPDIARVYHYSNQFGEAESILSGTDLSTGKHEAILWYHDHAMMRTASNVYCGLAGTYLVEGHKERNVIYSLLGGINLEYPNLELKHTDKTHDIPLMISDKSFIKGSEFLYYQSFQNNENENGQPEFLGDMIVVNGKVWPTQHADRGLYRYRLLNMSSSRTYSFALMKKDLKGQFIPVEKDSNFIQIGTEQGIIPLEKNTFFPFITFDTSLTLMPGERADVLINFSQISDTLYLVNRAKNSVFNYLDSSLLNVQEFNDQKNPTKFVMRFIPGPIVNQIGNPNITCTINNADLINGLKNWQLDSTTILNQADPNSKSTQKLLQKISDLKNEAVNHRKVSEINILNADLSKREYILNRLPENLFKSVSLPIIPNYIKDSFVLKEITTYKALQADNILTDYWKKMDQSKISFPFILINNEDWNSEAHLKKVAIFENNQTYEIDIINNTKDAHPIHLHLNRFKIIHRSFHDSIKHQEPVLSNERGWKDVAIAPPHCTTTIQITFKLTPEDLAKQNTDAQFVYHCHILEHEDMGMMRRLVVRKK